MRGRSALVLVLAMSVPAPALAQRQALTVHVGAVTIPSQRRAMFEGTVGTSRGGIVGLETSARWRFVSVGARLIGGGFAPDSGGEATGRVHNGDVRVGFGPEEFSTEIGYGRRAFSGSLGSRSWGFARLGARSRVAIGASGFTAEVAVAFYAPARGTDGSRTGGGREAETRLTYASGRLPVYVTVGYRHERFSAGTDSDPRPENVTGVLLAMGMRFRP